MDGNVALSASDAAKFSGIQLSESYTSVSLSFFKSTAVDSSFVPGIIRCYYSTLFKTMGNALLCNISPLKHLNLVCRRRLGFVFLVQLLFS